MKRNILYLITSILLLSSLGCRKGDNDPFLSLKTRKSRISRTWIYTEGTTEFSSLGSTHHYNYTIQFQHNFQKENSILIANNTMDTTLESKSYKFVYSISFSKNGKYTSNTECYFESGNKNYDLVEEGNWSFVLKNKSGDLKNKEAIELFRSSSNYIEYEDTPANEEITTYIYSIIPESPSFFLIDRLTKDELILTTSNALNSNLINSAMGYTSAYTSTYNMKQTFQAK